MATRKIKICDGFKLITSDKVYRLKSPMEIWKAFGWDIDKDKEASASATEITRQLLCFGRIDLSQFTGDHKTCIIEVIPADNFKVQWREQGKKRWKDLDDIRRYEDECKEEVERLTNTCDTGKEFRVGRWE